MHKIVDIMVDFSFLTQKEARASIATWSGKGQAGILPASVGVDMQYDILHITAEKTKNKTRDKACDHAQRA